ncbi:TIGR04283 family arsenosugar biosynthesis glycosyltransferase [Marinobacter sp.]|uniref:TIGR04283 family arsenosugar biosynthesis glycosyltransferase n=1 Tax=Marinobacter sp. TaxID=50741 RepID=UPI001A0BA4E2|nr:TIGR04283 family arsenosugar biosynthesis glycosyltransferase [Marinobacter sp.]MBE0485902.1 TIGR04283 family arsenosugar biosynthesis glycosyltransferase [Marinobacter sp.]
MKSNPSHVLSVSVVMPVWMEAAGIEESLRALQPIRQAGHEVIVVDGGSSDRTVELARPLCDHLLVSNPGRAIQMNAGADKAQGHLILFLHADTRLPDDALARLTKVCRDDAAWGRFDVRLSGDRRMFRVVEWFMNWRSRLTGICTGDQGIFVRRDVFETLGGFRPMPLMEDVELSKRLKLMARPMCIASPVVTDSRRWEQGGVWPTIVLMWRLRWRYWRGDTPESLAALWRRNVRHAKH